MQIPWNILSSKRKLLFFFLALGFATALIAVIALNKGIFRVGRSPADIRADYVSVGPHKKPVVTVFVHGVLGSSSDTWVKSGESFPTLFADDPEFARYSDVFLYEYFTPQFGTAGSIVDLADELRSSLEYNRLFEDHQKVVFISHSMGGLVVRRYLLNLLIKKRSQISQIAMLYFYASPTNGAELASVAKKISTNPQFRGMVPLDANDLLKSIHSDWTASEELTKTTPTYCAYETLDIEGIGRIVSEASATALCNQQPDAITADHIEIVKPKDTKDRRYYPFALAMRKSVIKSPIEVSSAEAQTPSEGSLISANARTYDTRSDWEAATVDVHAVDFSGMVKDKESRPLVSPPGITRDKITLDLINHRGTLYLIGKGLYYPDVPVVSSQGLLGEYPHTIEISFPPTKGVGVEFGQMNVQARFVFAISTGEGFGRLLPRGLHFFGVTTKTPITSLSIHMFPSGYALNVASVLSGSPMP